MEILNKQYLINNLKLHFSGEENDYQQGKLTVSDQ